MKKSRFTDAQIMGVLKQAEGGIPIADLCREHAISAATFYLWRSKFGGMDASMMAEHKAMQEENPAAEEDVCRAVDAERAFEGGARPKIDRPSRRRDGRHCSGAEESQHCSCLPDVWHQRDVLPL